MDGQLMQKINNIDICGKLFEATTTYGLNQSQQAVQISK